MTKTERESEEKPEKELVAITELEMSTRDFVAEHLHAYLQSGGADGHIIDNSALGGYRLTTTLLLRTIGHKSGLPRIAPLIYGDIGGEVVIVASKGGADVHPAWYLNIKNQEELEFQIATQAFRATWREPYGSEREDVWSFMTKIYPPYTAYQTGTTRQIPIVLMNPVDNADIFKSSE